MHLKQVSSPSSQDSKHDYPRAFLQGRSNMLHQVSNLLLSMFWAMLELLFSRLTCGASCRAHISSTHRQWQCEQNGNSGVLKAQNSNPDYDLILNGQPLLPQRNTSALPTQTLVSVSMTAEKPIACGLFSFAILCCSPLHCTQSSVCVYVYTIIYG